MSRRFLSLFISLVLPVQPAWAQIALRQLESLQNVHTAPVFFDGSKTRGRAASWSPDTLREIKDLLSHGTTLPDGSPIMPFSFRLAGGEIVVAPAAGLEGFLFAENGINGALGREAVAHHLDDYFRYLNALLAPVSWAEDGRAYINNLQASSLSAADKYDRLMAFVAEYTQSLRQSVASADASAWARSARVYEIFPRAFNLEGRRAARDSWHPLSSGFFAGFREGDFRDIRDQGFDTLWVMGIFPIGERNRSGTGGGSPYSIKDHAGLNPELGTPEEFRAFTARAHAAGLRVLIDFVPNHTAMDSKLALAHPEYFIHREAGAGTPPDGYFPLRGLDGKNYWLRHGGFMWGEGRSYWIDTAQVDYSNPYFQREMIDIVEKWVANFNVDGFRVDMAYLVLNEYFDRTWGLEKGGPMPGREFLEALITEVKARHPGTAFIAESYDRWDDLSKAGFDLIYGKNDMARPGGHQGWYDSLESRDPTRIRQAIRRGAYLHWQKGGGGVLSFVGNHDEVSPERAFREWLPGAAFLTLFMPGAVLFYGSQEVGFDQPSAGEQKSIPFDVPLQVDWSGGNAELTRFYKETFALAAGLREQLGDSDIEDLPGQGNPAWVGYLLTPRDAGRTHIRAAAVLANPSNAAVEVRFARPQLGIDYSGSLPPHGYTLIRF